MKTILVVNVNWIGDVIFSTPVFRALRQHYPDAKIVSLAVPRVVPVLEACPDVDEVIVYDEKGRHRWPWGKLALIRQLRRFQFDAAFLLHRSWTRAFLVYGSGARQRIGYDLKNLGHLLTHTVSHPGEGIHRSDYYLKIVESYGVPVTDRRTRLVPSDQSREEIRRRLKSEEIDDGDFVIVLNTGGNWNLKQWPPESFAAVIRLLAQEASLPVRIVVSGAPKDLERVQRIQNLAAGTPCTILAGQTSLPQVFALMERANLVISADSGPLHIASSVGTATIAIFGPTRPEITGPRGEGSSVVLQKDLDCNRRACYRLDCPENRCMKSVTPQEVVREAVRIYHRQTAQTKDRL